MSTPSCPPVAPQFQVIEHLHSNRVHVVRILCTYSINGHTDFFTETGSARCHPADRDKTSVGLTLATSRAIAKAGKRLDRRVQGYVKHADDIATHQANLKPIPKKIKKAQKAAAKKATVKVQHIEE